jgi:bromodomain adjacent to zinc finger domain protein 1A
VLEPKKEVETVDDPMDAPLADRAISPIASGVPNGTNTERDELDDSPPPPSNSSQAHHPRDDDAGPSSSLATASRQKALKEKAAEREATTTMKALQNAQARLTKAQLADRKRLIDEEAVLKGKLHELEYDFRKFYHTIRARPLGLDRFGNKVWWFDGIGSAPLGKLPIGGWGTGRIYVQGVEEEEEEWLRVSASTLGYGKIAKLDVEKRRVKEEGEGRLSSGEWGVYDTQEQVCSLKHIE